uniref:Toxin CSTX-10 n=1 Tax=Cupiennius salei TaxID=6928 RepID=TXC10_CUPSA|nr:RecName: Full=Toxin CSTX-10; Flags: Precursor [Cupiennius salei]QDC23095.1 toxin 10 isoform a S1 precursor [Cupiennius salei]QDC23096.1 toxin 10 isoform a S2 precursor [Cupiennius salei]
MKVLVIFAVLSLVIFSNCSAETDEDFFGEESFEADDIIPFIAKEQVRKDKENCIGKHHECTDDRDNCCKGKLFRYQCQCFKVIDGKKETKRCACVTPLHYKMAEMAVSVFKKMFKN